VILIRTFEIDFLTVKVSGVVLSFKRGWHPQPIHGQPDAVLSGTSSQKLIFFASFYKILIKKEQGRETVHMGGLSTIEGSAVVMEKTDER
jgi:hypothetical protein